LQISGGNCKLGNVRTDQIKRTAKELIRRFPNEFSDNFENNKQVVNKLTQGTTTKIRNQIAGYITRCLAIGETEGPSETSEEGEDQ
jgi:small subunit ribosomal protein S17e